MERTNMGRGTIRAFFEEGRPLYLETVERREDGADTPRRYRIYGVRVRKGRFEVKLLRSGKTKWHPASERQVVYAA